jgi:hypothetical protein
VRFTSALKRIFDPHVCVIETNDAVNYSRGEPGAANAKTQGFLYGSLCRLAWALPKLERYIQWDFDNRDVDK